jgi:N-acetylglucosaminyldiphosphoundecaprenol N-acetyl-beta-D-mannosaminyltransferase
MVRFMQVAQPAVDGRTRVRLAGVWLDRLTERELVDQVMASSYVSRGGWIATPNTSMLRMAASDPTVASLLELATMRVADGVPLVWASRWLPGGRLERVTGASLMISLSDACARHDRSVYLLGGEDGAAVEASERLQKRFSGLRVVGAESPWIRADLPDEDIDPIIDRLVAAQPDVVFCGFGFPKQELLIQRARIALPGAWFLACGAAVNFAAGRQRRAPEWIQNCGLEWCYRLAQEPRRLARRYASDVPFALRLLGVSSRHALIKPATQVPGTETVVVPEFAAMTVDLVGAIEDQPAAPAIVLGHTQAAASNLVR